jgi:hypothetical protein
MANLAVDAGHPFCTPEPVTVFFMRQEKDGSIELAKEFK